MPPGVPLVMDRDTLTLEKLWETAQPYVDKIDIKFHYGLRYIDEDNDVITLATAGDVEHLRNNTNIQSLFLTRLFPREMEDMEQIKTKLFGIAASSLNA